MKFYTPTIISEHYMSTLSEFFYEVDEFDKQLLFLTKFLITSRTKNKSEKYINNDF